MRCKIAQSVLALRRRRRSGSLATFSSCTTRIPLESDLLLLLLSACPSAVPSHLACSSRTSGTFCRVPLQATCKRSTRIGLHSGPRPREEKEEEEEEDRGPRRFAGSWLTRRDRGSSTQAARGAQARDAEGHGLVHGCSGRSKGEEHLLERYEERVRRSRGTRAVDPSRPQDLKQQTF